MSTLLPLFVVSAALAAAPDQGAYFKITVVDQETGRGVPLVELKTVNRIRFYTDSAGVVAFHEPGLMGRQLFFENVQHFNNMTIWLGFQSGSSCMKFLHKRPPQVFVKHF